MKYFVLLTVFLILFATPSLALATGPFDAGVEGLRWGCSLQKAISKLGPLVSRIQKQLRPHDLPYLRELGSLYWLEAKNFSRLTIVRGEGELAQGSYLCFFRDRLFCVQRHYLDGAAEWQKLYDKLSTGYGNDKKSVSRGPEGLYVTRLWDRHIVHVDLNYTSRKATDRTGYVFERIVLLVKHRLVLDEISALHRKLRKKYDWESGQESQQ